MENLGLSHLLIYFSFAITIWVASNIVDKYIIPVIAEKHSIINILWGKLKIFLWLTYVAIVFVLLIRVNIINTLAGLIIVLGIGWNYWRNIFHGILIKFDNRLHKDEIISNKYTTGKIVKINMASTEILNDNGEIVIIPNFKMRSSVLKHLLKKNNVKIYSFFISGNKKTNFEDIYLSAISCPYITANQEINIEIIKENNYKLSASLLDESYVQNVEYYFKQ